LFAFFQLKGDGIYNVSLEDKKKKEERKLLELAWHISAC
jgi:hypothetical protein